MLGVQGPVDYGARTRATPIVGPDGSRRSVEKARYARACSDRGHARGRTARVATVAADVSITYDP
jgi:hypothetical protein